MTSDALLTDRRDRVLAAMADADLDVLVLGRQDDANFAAGMHRLWTAGTRPFGAGCIVVRSTGRTHVLSSWDAGLPATMSVDDLYPATWNPRIMAGYLAEVPGLSTARRIGVDEVSPSFARAAARIAPGATVVPADDVIAAARCRKAPEEIELIRQSCAVARMGVEAVLKDPSDGIARAIIAMAAQGATIPSSAPSARSLPDGFTIDIGVIVDGYEGGIGGRFIAAGRVSRSKLPAACRAGATHRDLTLAATDANWLVRGLGMGFEKPVMNTRLGTGQVLEQGMVLSVSDGEHRDVVLVTAGEPEVLSIARAEETVERRES